MNVRNKKSKRVIKDIQKTIFMLVAPKHKEDAVTLRQIREDTWKRLNTQNSQWNDTQRKCQLVP